jgi:hypothetical protein
MNLVYIFTSCLFKIHLNIFLTSTPRSSKWSSPFRFCMSYVYYMPCTERCGRVVNTPASYSGFPRFKSQFGGWLSRQLFTFYLCPSRQVPSLYLKLDHDRFLPHPFQFTIHLLSSHSTLYSLSCQESCSFKLQINK